MKPSLERLVRERASQRCEYCRLPQEFDARRMHIEHVVARQHGGRCDESNLALAWFRCNLRKGPNLAGIDPASGELTRLFHPRGDAWQDHFAWQGALLVGRTPVGRATVNVLGVNDAMLLATREQLQAAGLWPP